MKSKFNPMKNFLLPVLFLIVGFTVHAQGIGTSLSDFPNSWYFKDMGLVDDGPVLMSHLLADKQDSISIDNIDLKIEDFSTYIKGITLSVLMNSEGKITGATITILKNIQATDEYQMKQSISKFIQYFSLMDPTKMAPVQRFILGGIEPESDELKRWADAYNTTGKSVSFLDERCNLDVINTDSYRCIMIYLNHN